MNEWNHGSIPYLLQGLNVWCNWDAHVSGGKRQKRPQPSTLADSFLAFDEVSSRRRTADSGIGIVFTKGIQVELPDGTTAWVVGIDCDACRDPVTGAIETWVSPLLRLGTYTEVTPSGTGIRPYLAVRNLPAEGTFKAKVRVPFPAAPRTNGKVPELQLFTRHGYTTVSGELVPGCAQEIRVVDNLDAVLDAYSMRLGTAADRPKLPAGVGPVPSPLQIMVKVVEQPHGRELIEGRWKEVTKKSASEAFFRLVGMVVEAANGHGGAATDFLLSSTAWGQGEIEDSYDPAKYMHRTWVERDVRRAAAKAPPSKGDVFEPLDDGQPDAPLPVGSPLHVVKEWATEGALVHLPTGIPSLDEMTGGGLVLGSRVFLAGAPDAGKTALAIQLADTYMARGICVAILAIDEEAGDIAMRLMQRRGLSRMACEQRAPATLQAAKEALSKLPLLLFGVGTTIEFAAAKLFQLAAGRPTVLVVDSIQVATCSAEDGDDSLYRSVTQRVQALRAVASKYRMLTITTSEMNRGAYKSKKAEEQTTDLASAKESGAIEYSARVLLALRSVPGTSDTVELRIAKNKHGPITRAEQNGIFLKVDRPTQTIAEDDGFEPLDEDSIKAEQTSERSQNDARALVRVLTANPGVNVRGMRAEMQKLGISKERAEIARGILRAAVVEKKGLKNATGLFLEASEVPLDLWS